MEDRLIREAQEQQMYELEVHRMEQEERELIMRLKNTKLVEEQSLAQLQKAQQDPLTP